MQTYGSSKMAFVLSPTPTGRRENGSILLLNRLVGLFSLLVWKLPGTLCCGWPPVNSSNDKMRRNDAAPKKGFIVPRCVLFILRRSWMNGEWRDLLLSHHWTAHTPVHNTITNVKLSELTPVFLLSLAFKQKSVEGGGINNREKHDTNKSQAGNGTVGSLVRSLIIPMALLYGANQERKRSHS